MKRIIRRQLSIGTPARHPQSSLRSAAGAALLAVAALAHGAPAAAVAEPQPRAATLGDCQSLLHQFDVAWPAHRDNVRAGTARHSRDLGEADCNQGRYADGVHQLRRALHDIGVKPVKPVKAAAAPSLR